MTTTPALVAPKTCSRCSGTGLVSDTVRRAHLGVPGLCFKCNGSGQVEGDKATLAAQKAEAEAAERAADRVRQATQIVWDATRFVEGSPAKMAWFGLQHLMAAEPDRHAKAVESILAGHPTVIQALHDYWKATHRIGR